MIVSSVCAVDGSRGLVLGILPLNLYCPHVTAVGYDNDYL